ncbi:type VI secretion system protein TssA [Geomonas sp. RF6]|uniref:type VI secretion system protein TssA n=1 Tax=Geomonas sp. RF6 TaxID=2897342 RepID=UPI001E5A0FEA|nr:type VI secretion system protein TssA [Geomonas sp. RF6]UFS69190.1 type VI secretion system protein TssA [Geomonas sp. RF6]
MEIAKLLDPIAGESAAGTEVRNDPLFEALQSEVEKLTCPSYAGIVDWEGVVELASEILAKKSKDLVVTSYLAVALLHTRTTEGVLPALRLYYGMLDNFWDDLYPVRAKARGRMLSVEWWLEKTLKALQGGKVSLPAGEETVALELLDKIEALLVERLPGAPSLEPLRRYFLEVGGGAADKVVPVVPVASDVRSPETLVPVPPPVEKTELPAVGGEDLEKTLGALMRCALLLRRGEPCNPLGYRLLRNALWSTVSALPPSLEGRTRIAAPDHQLAATLRELRQKRCAKHLLEVSEERLARFALWLDLNRLSFEALGHLGGSYLSAQEAVVHETCHLLLRLPGLVELSFCDGTPFADAETRRWLRQTLPASTPPSPQVVPSQEVAEGDVVALPGAVEEAQLLAREGQLTEAVHLLHEKVQGCRSGRERLVWRLSLLDFLLGVGCTDIALPQSEVVMSALDRHALEKYEPGLALSGLKLAYLALQAQKEPAQQERAQGILRRIGRLDPAEMLRLEKVAEIPRE